MNPLHPAPLAPDRIAAELCRALRGPRSQVQLARRLGYRSNVPASWESGRSAPPATTFFAACETLGVPLADGMGAFFSEAVDFVANLGEPAGTAALIQKLRGSLSTRALSERTGLSRHALGRWQRGEATPRLPDLIAIVHHATGRLLDFIHLIVDPATLPSLAERWRQLVVGRDLLIERPWVQPVLLALELVDYRSLERHDTGWLAARLGLQPAVVEEGLRALADTDQIRWTGSHWSLHRVRTIETRRSTAGVVAMRGWFAERALERLRWDQADATFSQNLFAVAEDDIERIRRLQVQYFRELQGLVSASEPSERVVFVQWSVVPWDVREHKD